MPNPHPVITTHERRIDYVTKLTVAAMADLMAEAPSTAEVKFTEHRADPRDQRETTSYTVSVTWKEGN